MTFKELYNNVVKLWEGTPLPIQPDLAPIFETWRSFNPTKNEWVTASPDHALNLDIQEEQAALKKHLQLLSWNVDAKAPCPKERFEELLNSVLYDIPPVDVIFLQGVTKEAMGVLLADERVREGWVMSGGGGDEKAINKGKGGYISVIMLSKVRFRYCGSVWRVKLPSRSQRTALCCDIFLDPSRKQRVRLINCHLDSLPTSAAPSLRPQQVEICASLIASSGRGLMAGDFHAALPEDERLVSANGLLDAWDEVRPGEDGFTWGVVNDGRQQQQQQQQQTSLPGSRRDKVALLKLVPREMHVHHPGMLSDNKQTPGGEGPFPWSDHSGISCTIDLAEE